MKIALYMGVGNGLLVAGNVDNFLNEKKTMAILHTNGKGIWSAEKRAINITRLTINEKYEGELRAYFTNKTWDTRKHGLIYTDPLFLRELKQLLKKKNLKSNINYTEQGMQGNNYVSLGYPRHVLDIKV